MIIKCEGIVKDYNKKMRALKGVDLEIPAGVFGLIGRNGAGKTTLLRIMASVLTATEGKVYFDGKPMDDNLAEYRSLLGYLPQNTKLMPQLNIEEFLEYMCILKGIRSKEEAKVEIERCIEISGLDSHRKKRLGKYSGGMLRRAGIAQALLGDPKILIIDEPTTGLDPEERLYFLNLISRISADKNIILSTHIIHDVENVCENVCILEKGEVMYAGATQGMVDSVTDRTWLYTGKAGEENLIKKLATVTNITYTTAGMQARYVADEPVVDGSEKIVGTLEDAYIAAVGGVSR